MEYFNSKNTASRYAKGRPDFHETIITKVKEYLKLNQNVNKALDVACGTGLSTKALLNIANEIYGTDISSEMIFNAPQNNKIKYLLAQAEKQPFPDAYFEIITVCSGIHWFQIDLFLFEAKRLLHPKAWLIIYDNFFLSEMLGNYDFNHWYNEVFCIQFPPPQRNNNYNWTKENLKDKGFDYKFEDTFKNNVNFSLEQLILYFTTQSNITSYIDKNQKSYTEIENWLKIQLKPFFKNQKEQTLFFGNWIKYLQKA